MYGGKSLSYAVFVESTLDDFVEKQPQEIAIAAASIPLSAKMQPLNVSCA